MGQFFVTSKEMDNEYSFFSKVFLYLWDDVLRFEEKSLFFSSDIQTFSQLKVAFQNKQLFLSDSVLNNLLSKVNEEQKNVEKSNEQDTNP